MLCQGCDKITAMTQENEKPREWKLQNVAQGILINQERVLLVGNDYGYRELVWSLPGGRLEAGEQHPSALVREFQEETGLEIVPGELLYVADARTPLTRQHFVTCVFRVELADANTTPDPTCITDEKVREVRFVPFEEAAQLLRPTLGEALIHYLYYRERLTRRYWRYSDYLRRDYQPLTWPPSPEIQAE